MSKTSPSTSTSTHSLRVGASTCGLHLREDRLIAHCGRSRNGRVPPVADAIAQVLEHPLGYPSLRESVLEEDRVVLAVDHSVPSARELIRGVILHLRSGGHRGAITVLLGADSGLESAVRGMVLAEEFVGIEVHTHDPSNRSAVAYLAADRAGRPVYLNRLLCDADLLISMNCLRVAGSPSYWGVRAGVFPEFADIAAYQRYRAPSASISRVRGTRRAVEAARAHWLLGARFTVQVVPGDDATILEVLAGDLDAVRSVGRERVAAEWRCEVSRRADLVIAALSGDPAWHTWENLARAMSAALSVVAEQGAIVLCTELSEPPGPGLRRWSDSHDLAEVRRFVERDPSPDGLFTWQVAKSLRDRRVYLQSRLAPDVIEDLGLTPISDFHEIQNLCDRSPSCVLISNAQFARPRQTRNPSRDVAAIS